MDNIARFFGEAYRDRNTRIASYSYIEDFIAIAHLDWSRSPPTPLIVKNFLEKISQLTLQDLAFLVVHSGYIPESYEADSSAETLYSKLIEAVVMEWAKRIGFSKSVLPTQKSSMEDVSILDDTNVIVCDAKSFRLGRSQAAPNVKDVLKHADIEKWLSAHPSKNRLGGLVVLPSQHDWKSGSDFYQYTTDKSSPTACLYYEHLAFFLISGMRSGNLIDVYESYPEIFPRKFTKIENNRAIYYKLVEEKLLSGQTDLWEQYLPTAKKIIAEKVYHCAHSLENLIGLLRKNIEEKYLNETDIEKLREKVIEAEFLQATQNLAKQRNRINTFRTVAKNYHEK
ncbi:MAG: HindIII family type II restriction endonuclease [Chitinophagales bacterium]|nr:HindIII family type II restriction endonuclease [Chitinophagales bacterium]